MDDQEILEMLLQKLDTDSFSRNQFVAIIGPMGCGKTTLLEAKIIPENRNKFHVSTDEYIQFMDKTGYTLYDLYRRSRTIGIQLTDHLLDKNISILCEATGQHKDFIEYMKRLKEKGFHITCYVVSTPLDICIERVKQRNEVSNRQVSIESVKEAYCKLWKENLEDIKKVSDLFEIVKTDTGRIYNTSEPSLVDLFEDFNFTKKDVSLNKVDFATLSRYLDTTHRLFDKDNKDCTLYTVCVAELENGEILDLPYYSGIRQDEDLLTVELHPHNLSFELIESKKVYLDSEYPKINNLYIEKIKNGFKIVIIHNKCLIANKNQLFKFCPISCEEGKTIRCGYFMKLIYSSHIIPENQTNKPIKIFSKY